MKKEERIKFYNKVKRCHYFSIAYDGKRKWEPPTMLGRNLTRLSPWLALHVIKKYIEEGADLNDVQVNGWRNNSNWRKPAFTRRGKYMKRALEFTIYGDGKKNGKNGK